MLVENNVQPTFINLKNLCLAKYELIYKIVDGMNVTSVNEINSKQQLQFIRIHNKFHHLNLMYLDSRLPEIIGDLALDVFINKMTSIEEYINSKSKLDDLGQNYNLRYYKYKLSDFVYMLLYSNISANEVFDGKEQTTRVYCSKNATESIQYFSIYERNALIDKLLNELKLSITIDKNVISKNEIKLHFKFNIL
jgi:hypothetical protein